MSLWHQPPPAPRTRAEDNPTLLLSWWCTGFAAVVIVTRLIGRKVRSNVLFREDWIMMLALVPLLARMGFIHVVLLWQTNNVRTVGERFSALDLEHRAVGSRLVLAARIFYALFIWMSKLTVSEFLKRTTVATWRRSYDLTLHGIRLFLAVTFVIVVVATLAECRPFDHYWQVVPDPGPHCRLGYGNLIAMASCDIITDILLVAFPIPIVLRSGQTWRRKLQLAALFSLSVIMIAVTATRVPEVIRHRGVQQYRTVWASCEILASAAVSNAVILGSFLRDKGTKRNKYRSQSVSDSIDRASSARRPTLTSIPDTTDSDEDLFRSVGIRIPAHLRDRTPASPRPAPAALPAAAVAVLPHATTSLRFSREAGPPAVDTDGPIAQRDGAADDDDDDDSDRSSRKMPVPEQRHSPPSPVASKKSVRFFDVGGLLNDGDDGGDVDFDDTTSLETLPRHHPGDPSRRPNVTVAQDFAPPTHPGQRRRGSHTIVHDRAIGLLLPPTMNRSAAAATAAAATSSRRQHASRLTSEPHTSLPSLLSSSSSSSSTPPPSSSSSSSQHPQRPAPPPTGVRGPMLERRDTQQSLQDAGGLLLPPATTAAPLAATHEGSSRGGGGGGGGGGWEDMEIGDPGGLLGGRR